MHSNHGKASLAVLGSLLVGSSFGWLPVARFVGAKAPEKPLPPPEPSAVLASAGLVRMGGVAVEARLSQTRLHRLDPNIWVDVNVTADSIPLSSERRPIDFALVLDVSGSMADANKIGLMKQACLDVGSRLGPQDRVSVVAFSTEARTLFSLAPISSKEYRRAIEELCPRGGTNISEGLELGAAELRKAVRPGAARRIVLLTDGQRNAGDSTPAGLRALCARLSQQGVSVTTVGLGLDYNAQLLSAMAEAGGGAYHYVDDAQRIAGIYDAELRSLRSLVARGVKLRLEPIGNAEIVKVVEWLPEHVGNGVEINVGDLESGRSTKVVAQLRLPPGESASNGLLRVTARCEDARNSTTLATAPLALGVQWTSSIEDAQASIVPEAKKDVESAQVATLLEEARVRVERGDEAGARAAYQELRAKRTTLSYRAADGHVESMNVDALERDAFGGGSNGQRAQLFMKSAVQAEAK